MRDICISFYQAFEDGTIKYYYLDKLKK